MFILSGCKGMHKYSNNQIFIHFFESLLTHVGAYITIFLPFLI